MTVARAPRLRTTFVSVLLLCALFSERPCAAENIRAGSGCRLAVAAIGAALVLSLGGLYLEHYRADVREQQDLKAAYDEGAEIETEQEKHDRARWQLYETGDPLPIYMLVHQIESREAKARGETPIGFGIGFDRAGVEKVLPPASPLDVLRTLAITTHGLCPTDRKMPHYPRRASSFLAGHNLENATTRERLVVVAGIANAYGIEAKLRSGWTKGETEPRTYLGNHNWVEFPTLGVCIDTERSPEPIATDRYLATYVSYSFNDRGRIVSTAGDVAAAEAFELSARGFLHRDRNRNRR